MIQHLAVDEAVDIGFTDQEEILGFFSSTQNKGRFRISN